MPAPPSERAINIDEVLRIPLDTPEFQRKYLPGEEIPDHLKNVDPSETLVDILDDRLPYDEQFRTDMCQLVASINEEVNQEMRGARAYIQRGILDEVYSTEEVIAHQEKYLSVKQIMTYSGAEDAVFAFPMNGALAILDKLRSDGVSLDRLFPVWIAGSRGTTTGFAEFLKQPSYEILDLQRTVIFADDVLDTCVTAIQLALERLRREEIEVVEKYSLLPQRIRENREGSEKKKFDDPVMKEIYQTAADLMKEAGVILAPLYSKNIAMQEALSKLANKSLGGNPSDSWNMMQKETVDATTSVSEDYWIMGGQGDWLYPLLDLGFDSADLLKAINSQNSSYAEKLKMLGFGNMKLRLFAGARNLLRLKDPYKLQELIVKALVEYMQQLQPPRLELAF